MARTAWWMVDGCSEHKLLECPLVDGGFVLALWRAGSFGEGEDKTGNLGEYIWMVFFPGIVEGSFGEGERKTGNSGEYGWRVFFAGTVGPRMARLGEQGNVSWLALAFETSTSYLKASWLMVDTCMARHW